MPWLETVRSNVASLFNKLRNISSASFEKAIPAARPMTREITAIMSVSQKSIIPRLCLSIPRML